LLRGGINHGVWGTEVPQRGPGQGPGGGLGANPPEAGTTVDKKNKPPI